jgi:hypothetical protein
MDPALIFAVGWWGYLICCYYFLTKRNILQTMFFAIITGDIVAINSSAAAKAVKEAGLRGWIILSIFALLPYSLVLIRYLYLKKKI